MIRVLALWLCEDLKNQHIQSSRCRLSENVNPVCRHTQCLTLHLGPHRLSAERSRFVGRGRLSSEGQVTRESLAEPQAGQPLYTSSLSDSAFLWLQNVTLAIQAGPELYGPSYHKHVQCSVLLCQGFLGESRYASLILPATYAQTVNAL